MSRPTLNKSFGGSFDKCDILRQLLTCPQQFPVLSLSSKVGLPLISSYSTMLLWIL